MNKFSELELVEVYQDEAGVYSIWSGKSWLLDGEEETKAIQIILKAPNLSEN